MITELKARQSAKIRELRDALIEAGLLTLDQQATAWALSKYHVDHPSASIINRMLVSPQLPPLVRAKVLEYIAKRAAGLHGHNKTQRRRFAARLSNERISTGQAAQF